MPRGGGGDWRISAPGRSLLSGLQTRQEWREGKGVCVCERQGRDDAVEEECGSRKAAAHRDETRRARQLSHLDLARRRLPLPTGQDLPITPRRANTDRHAVWALWRGRQAQLEAVAFTRQVGR